MGVLSVTRWVLTALSRRATAWGALLLLGAFEPLVTALAPFHIGSYGPDLGATFEVAFAGALVGTLHGLSVLAGRGMLFRPAGRGGRTLAEGVALLAAAAPFSLAALGGAALASMPSTADGRPFAWMPLATSLAWSHAHLAGIALLALRLPAPTTVRSAFLVSFAWVLPMLSETKGGDVGFVAFVSGACLHGPGPAQDAGTASRTLASIAALWWLATLLGTPRSEPR